MELSSEQSAEHKTNLETIYNSGILSHFQSTTWTKKPIANMNKQNLYLSKISSLGGALHMILNSTRSQVPESSQAKQKPVVIPGEVHLASNSPKKTYLKTDNLVMTQHPLLQPIAGKIVYDESLTSRVSSPVAGMIITTPLALGAQVKTATAKPMIDVQGIMK